MSDAGQMGTDLMGTPGNKMYFQQCHVFIHFHRMICCLNIRSIRKSLFVNRYFIVLVILCQISFQMSTVHHPKPEIVYEDEDILILNKPVGILSQKAEKNDYSANEMVIDYLLESGQLTRA